MIRIGTVLLNRSTGLEFVVIDIAVNQSGHVQVYFDDGSDATVDEIWRYYTIQGLV